MKISQEYDKLVVDGKINGRRANRLIYPGSTHDCISESLICRQTIATQSSSKACKVTRADGTVLCRNLEETIHVNVLVKDFGETQSFTATILS